MSKLTKLQSSLDVLKTQRAQIAGEGWILQHSWLVQVKPGGTARTDCKYWQVRSRQPLFEGKTLKHLKPEEVEDYRNAITRGRQLKQIDRQIEKLQQQLEQLTATAEPSEQISIPRQIPTLPSGESQRSLQEQPQSIVKLTDLTEQDRLVKEIVAKSQALRASLRQSVALGKLLGARSINLRSEIPEID